MSRLGEILTETTNPPIRALMVWGCNPLVIAPNSERGTHAWVLRDDLFTVVHEQFITDTARYADISACPPPLSSRGNRCSCSVGTPLAQLEQRRHRAVWRGGGRQQSLQALARAMVGAEGPRARRIRGGYTQAWTRPRRVAAPVRVCASPVPADGSCSSATGCSRPPRQGGTRQPTLVAMGQPAAPKPSVPPIEGPGTVMAERYPLQLMTPKHHNRFLNSGNLNLPRQGRGVRPFGELCADDAASRGVAEARAGGSSFQRPGLGGSASADLAEKNLVRPGPRLDPVGLVEPASSRTRWPPTRSPTTP